MAREPVGVAGLIIPWNGPFFVAMLKAAPALAAGCSCVLKPAEETPLTALKLEEIFREAGLPDGVFNVITGADMARGSYASWTGVASGRVTINTLVKVPFRSRGSFGVAHGIATTFTRRRRSPATRPMMR